MRRVGLAKILLINLVVLLGLLTLIEGASSIALVGYRFYSEQRWREIVHTEFDEQLGWVSLPNHHVEDKYGPGISLTTNSQRFRNSKDFGRSVPPGKIRIICSGDSFTLGHLVSNEESWCHLLTQIDSRIETVNLGQSGYGVDQAYLWYDRNKDELDHNVHLFAFIVDDFHRAESATLNSFNKPFLAIEDQEIVQTNYPVSRRSFQMRWLTEGIPALKRLKSIQLANKVRERIVRSGPPATGNNPATEAVISKIFANLQETNSNKSSVFILVFLPVLADYTAKQKSTTQWVDFLEKESKNNKYYFFNIVEDIRKYPPQAVNSLYKGFHYSKKGHEYIAGLLYEKLTAIPEIRRRMSALSRTK